MKNFIILSIFLLGLLWGNSLGISLKNSKIKPMVLMHNVYERIFKILHRKIIDHADSWIDVRACVDCSKKIHLSLEKDVVTCKSTRSIVSVKIVDRKLISSNELHSLYHIHVVYKDMEKGSTVINPLPVSISKQMEGDEKNRKEVLLPVGFEGYIVCMSKKTEAYLVPKTIDQVQFIEAPWRVRVKIDIRKHPLSTHGILYRFTIMDNISILQDKRKHFFLALDSISLFTGYYIMLAMKEQERGKYCTLSQDSNMSSPELSCFDWKSDGFSQNNVNLGFFVLFITICLVNGYYITNIKSSNYKTFLFYDKKKKIGMNLIATEPEEIDRAKVLPELLRQSKNMNDHKIAASVTSFLLFFLLAIGYNVFKLMHSIPAFIKNVKLMERIYTEAPFAYQWSLSKKNVKLH